MSKTGDFARHPLILRICLVGMLFSPIFLQDSPAQGHFAVMENKSSIQDLAQIKSSNSSCVCQKHQDAPNAYPNTQKPPNRGHHSSGN